MTKINRHRTYGMTPEWRIIANVLTEGTDSSEKLTDRIQDGSRENLIADES
jgi:hypothetical protein